MPTIRVNEVTVAYEVLGNGPAVVWTPGGWFPRNEWAYLNAGCFCADYTNLLWYRRNSGLSDVAIEDAPSEFHLWADDLHALLHALHLSPAYLAGGSAGNLFSLLMAYRYPEDVKGLILIGSPANDLTLIGPLLEAHYLQLAEVAATKGMAAVIAHSTDAWVRMALAKAQPEDRALNWVAATIAVNPNNHTRLLAMEPIKFATIMKQWGRSCLDWASAKRFHLCGLSDEQVHQITAPALVIPGFDDLHPRQEAEALYRLLPNAEWVDFAHHYPQETLDQMAASEVLWHQQSFLSMPFMRKFLQRIDSE